MDFKVIAVDFDGTLCENNWPDIGMPNYDMMDYLINEQTNGAKLILWTCRTGVRLSDAISWCWSNNLFFDAVNENIPEAIFEFGEDTRKVFADEYIDDHGSTKFKLPYVKEEESNMMSWAKREIEIACKRERAAKTQQDEDFDLDWDYGCACYESAFKAFKSLCEDGHSGFSIDMTKHILNRLIEGKALTPIEDTPDAWYDISDISGLHGEEVNYQCKRMSSLFKYVYADGSVKYRDVNRAYGASINNPNASYHSGLVDKVIDELYPISMPYSPGKSIAVYTEDFLTDKKNDDYDTVGILYAILSDGERVELNRFFKESDDGFAEIGRDEYDKRKEIAISI